ALRRSGIKADGRSGTDVVRAPDSWDKAAPDPKDTSLHRPVSPGVVGPDNEHIAPLTQTFGGGQLEPADPEFRCLRHVLDGAAIELGTEVDPVGFRSQNRHRRPL